MPKEFLYATGLRSEEEVVNQADFFYFIVLAIGVNFVYFVYK